MFVAQRERVIGLTPSSCARRWRTRGGRITSPSNERHVFVSSIHFGPPLQEKKQCSNIFFVCRERQIRRLARKYHTTSGCRSQQWIWGGSPSGGMPLRIPPEAIPIHLDARVS